MNPENQAIYQFIDGKMRGRNLRTEETAYSLDEGRLEGRYSDEMFFSGVLLGEDGFMFDMTTISREKVYALRPGTEERDGVKRDFTGVSVFHYEIAERKSTGKLTGIMRLSSSTVRGHTMSAVVYGVYGLELSGQQLRWNEDQLLYRDMPDSAGGHKPVAFDAKVRVYFDGEKMRFEYAPSYFDVDARSFSKMKSSDAYPLFVSREA